jgi:hypothetical protein
MISVSKSLQKGYNRYNGNPYYPLKILKFFVPKGRALELEKASRNIEN